LLGIEVLFLLLASFLDSPSRPFFFCGRGFSFCSRLSDIDASFYARVDRMVPFFSLHFIACSSSPLFFFFYDQGKALLTPSVAFFLRLYVGKSRPFYLLVGPAS